LKALKKIAQTSQGASKTFFEARISHEMENAIKTRIYPMSGCPLKFQSGHWTTLFFDMTVIVIFCK